MTGPARRVVGVPGRARGARGAAIVVAALVAGGVAALVTPRLRLIATRPARSTTTLVLRVTDRGVPVAARVLLVDAHGAALHMGNLDLYGRRQGATACVLAPDVVGSWDGLILGHGLAEVPVGADRCVPSPAIPYGRYKVVAWRGIEYERFEGEVDLSAGRGRVELAIALVRAWTPAGVLAADLHVHARASNDSRLPNPQRVIAQAAAGIQVVGLSDHNVHGDLDAEIAELHLERQIASIASDELTAEQLHVGVYPVEVARGAPRGGGPADDAVAHASAAELFALARAMPGHPIVQLNHPRFRVTALYDGTGWDGVSWPPPFPLAFDAVEVLAGYSAFNAPGDRRFDDSARDLYTLIDHGHLIAPVGNSDTHDLNWVLDGTTRSYVYVDDTRLAPFDEAGFIAALRARRVVATSGPWLDVEVAAAHGATPTVGPGQALAARGHAWVDITIAQARFVHTERIRITVGGPAGPALATTIDVPAGVPTFHWAGAVELPDTDTWIGVTADGDTPLPLEQTGSYQKDRWSRGGVTPFAIISPVLVDVDGDHRWKRGDADLALP
ncbi:MAG TPA: CehA/McbA family metallohydrolase [Kofleriaceae bacterium]|nr:CehA/McbA family metallohydrolase [Kofleriaceae bacterium]